ncbi:unnamed protein product [Cylicocyclus nassatus]|uniref:Uncharacterized protein n=1 Tax=Cylicocyclus nassatus TaxID=53992 RepID=A0AA36DU09_CYLNA|nr:unnamed protein product [Cylicocyclus nassatus]
MLPFNLAYTALLTLSLSFQGTTGQRPCPNDLYDTNLCPSKENCYKDPKAIKYTPPQNPAIQCPGNYFMRFTFTDNKAMDNLIVKRDWKFLKCQNGEWKMDYWPYWLPIRHLACYPKRI